MASNAQVVSPMDARKAEIDNQAAAIIANSPAVQSKLPPIPPSPFQHRQEVERNAKAADLVRAAGDGQQSRFQDIARDLGLSSQQAGTLYADLRKQYLEKREELLAHECATAAINGTPEMQSYWMNQLMLNTLEIGRLHGGATPKELNDALSAVSREIRSAGGPEYTSRMESMLSSALEAGFPIRAVLGTAQTFNVSSESSPVIPGETVSKHLLDLAKHYLDQQLAHCATLYGQKNSGPSAEMEFRRAYNQLLRFCDGLLPPGVGTDQDLATQQGRQRIASVVGFNMDNLYGPGKSYP